MIKTTIKVLLILVLVVFICYNLKLRLSPIPIPDRIIIYSDGIQTEINKKDFKEIVDLTNKRFYSKIYKVKDVVDNYTVFIEKKGVLGIEFIYNTRHKFSVFGWESFKYNKLFFPLINTDTPDITGTFQYGDTKDYVGCSIAPINMSDELIISVKCIKLKYI